MDWIGRRCSSSTGVGTLLGFCLVETTVSVSAVLSLDIFQRGLLTWFIVPIATTCLRTLFINVSLLQCVRRGRGEEAVGAEAFGAETTVWSLPVSSIILCVWYSVSIALIASPGNVYQHACFVGLVLANAGLCCLSISMLHWYDRQNRLRHRRVMPVTLPRGDPSPALPALLGRTQRTVPVTLFDFDADRKVPVCAICLSEPCCGEELAKLPCNHVFHVGCIATWAKRSCGVLCPMRCDAEGAFAEEIRSPEEGSSTTLAEVQLAERSQFQHEVRQQAWHRQLQHPQTERHATATEQLRLAVSRGELSRDDEAISPQMLWIEDISTHVQQI